MKRRLAFTLIELLMIVSIIVVLITILLPSVRSALEFPRRSTCLSNLKQIGIGLYNYQGANNGYMPPFCSGSNAAIPYDWIWPDTLAPYVDSNGKQAGPGVESGINYPGKSIWACPDAQINPDPDVVADYGTEFPTGGFRTNYANTCGSVATGTWQPAANNAGLIMSDGHRTSTSTFDSYKVCNRYTQMDSQSVLIFCGCYGCSADHGNPCGTSGGFPDPATLPRDWNANSVFPPTPSPVPGPGVIIIPFAHLHQTPALTVNGSVKGYGKGTQMGGGPNDTDTSGKDTWVPIVH
jgi:type II secretory pathway pseudopilin PulG